MSEYFGSDGTVKDVGTGLLIRPDGTALTAHHVVRGGQHRMCTERRFRCTLPNCCGKRPGGYGGTEAVPPNRSFGDRAALSVYTSAHDERYLSGRRLASGDAGAGAR
ncbi:MULTISPECIES: hypothetical protein [unclassified Paenibacillus]|uniref:hypothetical protein n=1 Tax=unclassified Paenibacillus TaxID=185978 RepID=UPI003642AA43